MASLPLPSTNSLTISVQKYRHKVSILIWQCLCLGNIAVLKYIYFLYCKWRNVIIIIIIKITNWFCNISISASPNFLFIVSNDYFIIIYYSWNVQQIMYYYIPQFLSITMWGMNFKLNHNLHKLDFNCFTRHTIMSCLQGILINNLGP